MCCSSLRWCVGETSTYNPLTAVEQFGNWAGRKVTTNPKKVDAIAKFIVGAACFPVLFVAYQCYMALLARLKIIEIASEVVKSCPEEMMREIATFSLVRRILAIPSIILLTTVVPAFLEECVFRGVLQGAILKTKITEFLENKFPNAVEFWNSKKGKFIRVCISTTLFALLHLLNSPVYPLLVIPLGIAASMLYEEYGLPASIGIHFTNNVAAIIPIIPILIRCYFP